MPSLTPFSADELAAMENQQFFRAKAAATARVKDAFAALRAAVRAELPAAPWLSAGAVDTAEGQLTGGENYEGLPYVVLDFPKCFSRDELLAMRTMLWWGHYVVYALLLRGPWLPEAVQRIDRALPELTRAGVEATVARDPWEWRRGEGYTRPLADDGATRAWLRERAFLKLMRFLPLQAAAFTPETIVETGLASWRLYARLVCGG